MIRGIKFRGKRIDNGELVYGYYAVIHHSLTEIDHKTNTIVRVGVEEISHIYNDEINDNCCNWKEVDADTVGQFTGLLDKNGKEIYEGDIVSYDDTPYCPSGNKYKGEVVVYRGAWCVKHYEAWCDEYFYSLLFSDDFANHKTVIIGNIYS